MRKIFVDSAKCLGCHSCELECAVAHSDAGSLFGAVAECPAPTARVSVGVSRSGSFPLQCRHCEDAQCVKACVTKALYRDEESGAILHKDDACIGCWMCAIACPFGVVEGNPKDGKVSKCDLCLSRDVEPACVQGCPTGALSFEDVEEYSQGKRREFLGEVEIKSGGEVRYE